MTKKSHETEIRRGSENIFADLGFPDPQTHLLKAQLVARVQDIMKARGLNQSEAARAMGVTQPDVSRMLKGLFRDISVERIMRMLTRLGCSVEIRVKPAGAKPRFAAIHLEPAE